MNLREKVRFRHSEYYKGILIQAASLYIKGGEAANEGLKLLDTEWPNISAGQRWVAEHIDEIDALAQSSYEYADGGGPILSFRLTP
jgi:hypothetical protein